MKRTNEELRNRIRLLSDEIDNNEEENRFMQDEISMLYDEIDSNEQGDINNG